MPMTAAFAEAELAGNRVPQSAAGFGPLQAAAGARPMAAAASAGQAAASEPRSVPMACKRSGVRIPIAPPQVKFVMGNPEPQSLGAWYSSKVPQRQRPEVSYANSDKAPRR